MVAKALETTATQRHPAIPLIDMGLIMRQLESVHLPHECQEFAVWHLLLLYLVQALVVV